MPSDSPVNAAGWRDHFTTGDFAAADAIVGDYFGRGGQPAIAYGIVAGGELVHSAGFGAKVLGAGPPDAGTVFRIASMSKSFTASAILLLRDAGALALDDPAAQYVPELAGWTYGSADSAPVTIRQLLTMTAGFPTDDPWGDRQQGLPITAFDELLAAGVSFNWAPGTRFEYSNLGYAILGRVLTMASGVLYDEFIRTRLLAPLGLSRTGFTADEFDTGNLAVGYRHGLGGWDEVPFDPYGAFAPMGGVFSTVADLARWVAGFAAAFPPDRDKGEDKGQDESDAHPLRPASRRQMQLPQAVTGWRAAGRLPGGPPAPPEYYGFGLFVDEDPSLGRVVSHSGGYPGFGSNMRWHPATGVGVIALGNGTYAPMSPLTGLVLDAVVPTSNAYQVALAPAASKPGAPWPQTLAAQEKVNDLLTDWDDDAADALFTENVALDSPYHERRHTIGLIRERIGPFSRRPHPGGRVRHPGPPPLVADRGERHRPGPDPAQPRARAPGHVTHPGRPAGPELAPGRDPRRPGRLAERPRSGVAGGGPGRRLGRRRPDRPPSADGGRLGRASARTGAFQAGSGTASVTVELVGEHATVTLSLLVNRSTGELRQADVTL